MVIKYNPKFLPNHDDWESVDPDDHHTKFDATDHDGRDHSNIQGIPRNLSELSDVDTSSLADGKVLKWDASSNKFIFADDEFNIIYNIGIFVGDSHINYIYINSPSNATNFGDLSENILGLGALSNGHGNRGVFTGGGANNSASYPINTMSYITINNPSIGVQDFGDLQFKRASACGLSNGSNNRGVIGSGHYYDTTQSRYIYVNYIDYITITSPANAQDFGDMYYGSEGVTSTSNGINNRGIFVGGGGANALDAVNNMQYITITSPGNATDFGDLLNKRTFIGTTSNSINNKAVFAGGMVLGSTCYKVIEFLNISSLGNASLNSDLMREREGMGATSNGIGDIAVFGGGRDDLNGNVVLNSIEYFNISTTNDTTTFGELLFSQVWIAATSNEI